MSFFKLLVKSVRYMAKNAPSKGKSARNGNAASPYKKYRKKPFNYGSEYRGNVLIGGILCRPNANGRPIPVIRHTKHKFKDAAE